MRIHHIGIAVVDLEESIELYSTVFGAALESRSTSEHEGQETALLRMGDVELELMRPLREDSAVGKFLARRGPGMHHVAYAVPDIRKALAGARDAGLEPIDAEPRIGVHGSPIAFLHPKSVGGVLTEFVEAT